MFHYAHAVLVCVSVHTHTHTHSLTHSLTAFYLPTHPLMDTGVVSPFGCCECVCTSLCVNVCFRFSQAWTWERRCRGMVTLCLVF